jgi:glyoxylase-like metal-dependent hydrolase (beta-lactamase superfamily II)
MNKIKGIRHLEISFDFNGAARVINPTLLWDEDNVLLVDTGFPGQMPLLRAAIRKAGVPFSKLNKIIITHQDWDHIGALAEIITAMGSNIEVLAHKLEKPYIQGDEVFLKKSQSAADVLMPAPVIPPFPRTRVTRLVNDGEELSFCGGIVVIHVPGHTLGHICLYHKLSKTLICGDALNVVDGKLTGPNPQYTHDMAKAIESLKKLAQFDIRTIICYHGGAFSQDPNRWIGEIVRGNL